VVPVAERFGWSWLNMGKPHGANIGSPIAAVTVRDASASPQRPHVFIEGDDSNVWIEWWG